MSGAPVAIRRLGPDDLAHARALNALFAQTFDDPETYASRPPSAAYLERCLARPQLVALVALDGSDVVGGLVAFELVKLESERSEFYLYDLAVAAEHRRRGVATALIERLRSVAAESGGWVVFVQADYGDEPAVALYTKLGRREDVMHFDIALALEQP
jgi:aminoglycoside 3-N-acetyltransferase I